MSDIILKKNEQWTITNDLVRSEKNLRFLETKEKQKRTLK